MAIQYAVDRRAAMPPRYHPAAKAAQQSKPQRNGQEQSRLDSQDAMETDPSQHGPQSRLQGELEEHIQSQRPDNAPSAPHLSTDQPILPPTEHHDRSHQHNEDQVDTFLNDLESHIQTINPALYSRLQAQYPVFTTNEPTIPSTTSTSNSQSHTSTTLQTTAPLQRQRRNAPEIHRISPRRTIAETRVPRPTTRSTRHAALQREFETGPTGGPQQSGANLVPVSERRWGVGRESSGGLTVGERVETVSGGAGAERVGAQQGQAGADIGGAGEGVSGDGCGNATRQGENVSEAEAEQGGRGGTAETGTGRSADGVLDGEDMEVEEGEERPRHDWSRTADW
ncbi:hypothetical protein MBLNU457_1615t1 [Dothideomycetes sp. NU457]